jgi:hypothetical protein
MNHSLPSTTPSSRTSPSPPSHHDHSYGASAPSSYKSFIPTIVLLAIIYNVLDYLAAPSIIHSSTSITESTPRVNSGYVYTGDDDNSNDDDSDADDSNDSNDDDSTDSFSGSSSPSQEACSAATASSAELAISEIAHRASHISNLLGPYKFFVYNDPPFTALSSDLPLPAPPVSPTLGYEALACVWTHRALLVDPSRTLDPDEADIFLVPAYLSISHHQSNQTTHDARLDTMLAALSSSPHYHASGGADHLFIGLSDVNSPNARSRGFAKVFDKLSKGYTGAFEINKGWTGGFPSDHIIALPYVANEHVVLDSGLDGLTHEQIVEESLRHRELAVAVSADSRKNAIKWANCDRSELKKLENFPKTSIHVDDGSERKSEHDFAMELVNSRFCPLVCGDTPTSRRTVDVALSSCVPLFIGTRLWGECDYPCAEGWGWIVAGKNNPHLPWQGTFFDWSGFPVLDEAGLYDAVDNQAAEALLEDTLDLEKWGSCSVPHMRASLLAARESFIYGIGDYRTSVRFGLAPRRLVESALLKLKGHYPPMPRGFQFEDWGAA